MQKSLPYLSIVSPVYQAENLIDELVERVSVSISSITDQFEIILVEDGSLDSSWRKIDENCKKDQRVKGIQLSRNFGQHIAIAAGINSALGEWIIVMDCDLQDPPEEIPSLYKKAKEGFEIVLGKREGVFDNKLKRCFSKLFYTLLSAVSGTKYDHAIANFGIYHRKTIEPLLQIHHSIRYFPSMVNWVGFKKTSIHVKRDQRPRGKSSYNFIKKIELACSAMLVYSDKPLKIITGFGIVISLMAFLFAIFVAYRAFQGQISVLGYPSLIISISFFSGVIISILGVLGLYIGKIFETIKVKPTYIINKRING